MVGIDKSEAWGKDWQASESLFKDRPGSLVYAKLDGLDVGAVLRHPSCQGRQFSVSTACLCTDIQMWQCSAS